MQTIGIVIDDWKLPIFKRHLDNAGYKIHEQLELTPGTLLLKIKTNDKPALGIVVASAMAECKITGGIDYGLKN